MGREAIDDRHFPLRRSPSSSTEAVPHRQQVPASYGPWIKRAERPLTLHRSRSVHWLNDFIEFKLSTLSGHPAG
jgi:hypothetical protein